MQAISDFTFKPEKDENQCAAWALVALSMGPLTIIKTGPRKQ